LVSSRGNYGRGAAAVAAVAAAVATVAVAAEARGVPEVVAAQRSRGPGSKEQSKGFLRSEARCCG